MNAPKVTKDDVGGVLIDEEGNLYKIKSYTNRPTIEVESVLSGQVSSFVVGSKGLEKFTKLVMEER